MVLLITEPCPGYYDGTDDNIRLEFRNHFASTPRETCTTDVLDKSGNEFVRGRQDQWGADILLTCSGRMFRPISGLDFRFHLESMGWFGQTDELKLCKVTVLFGSPGVPGYSKWQWTGTTINEHWTGSYNSYSNWNTLIKIAG